MVSVGRKYFCFYYMFKTRFSDTTKFTVAQKIWGHCHRMRPVTTGLSCALIFANMPTLFWGYFSLNIINITAKANDTTDILQTFRYLSKRLQDVSCIVCFGRDIYYKAIQHFRFSCTKVFVTFYFLYYYFFISLYC